MPSLTHPTSLDGRYCVIETVMLGDHISSLARGGQHFVVLWPMAPLGGSERLAVVTSKRNEVFNEEEESRREVQGSRDMSVRV